MADLKHLIAVAGEVEAAAKAHGFEETYLGPASRPVWRLRRGRQQVGKLLFVRPGVWRVDSPSGSFTHYGGGPAEALKLLAEDMARGPNLWAADAEWIDGSGKLIAVAQDFAHPGDDCGALEGTPEEIAAALVKYLRGSVLWSALDEQPLSMRAAA